MRSAKLRSYTIESAPWPQAGYRARLVIGSRGAFYRSSVVGCVSLGDRGRMSAAKALWNARILGLCVTRVR